MTNSRFRHLDAWSIIVILLSFALFGAALFVKGLTHDLLLESGVFLVSVKLINMAHKNAVHAAMIEEQLDRIYQELRTPQQP